MARMKVVDTNGATAQPTTQPTVQSTDSGELRALLDRFAETVAVYEKKTVWWSSFDRPYRAVLAAAQAVIALGYVATSCHQVELPEQARDWLAKSVTLAEQCLDTPAGHSRALRMGDYHMAAVTAKVAAACCQPARVGEALAAVETLYAMGVRRG